MEKSKFNIQDKVIHKNETGTVIDKRFIYHFDMYKYLVKFDEVEIILRENELEKHRGL